MIDVWAMVRQRGTAHRAGHCLVSVHVSKVSYSQECHHVTLEGDVRNDKRAKSLITD